MPEPGQAHGAVSAKYTPFEVKELLLEFAMRNFPNKGITTNLKDDDLDRMMYFDPARLKTIDNGAPFYIGTDLHTALENSDYEVKRGDFLLTLGPLVNSDKELQIRMLELLREELEHIGYSEKEIEDVPARQQILVIAGARIRNAMLAPELHVITASGDNFDFVVQLTTLRGGNAAAQETQRMFFEIPAIHKSSASYANFLARLQDATQLSVIPPLEPYEPYDTSFSANEPAEATNNPANALGIMLPTPPASFTTTTTTTPNPKPKRGIKGYTILDGPWIYTAKKDMAIMHGKLGVEKDKKLGDKPSYDDMIQNLRHEKILKRAMTKGVPPSHPVLLVEMIHSMDYNAIKRYMEEQQAIDQEENQFREDLKARGLTEDDVGEPFGAYLKNEIAKERKNSYISASLPAYKVEIDQPL